MTVRIEETRHFHEEDLYTANIFADGTAIGTIHYGREDHKQYSVNVVLGSLTFTRYYEHTITAEAIENLVKNFVTTALNKNALTPTPSTDQLQQLKQIAYYYHFSLKNELHP